MKYFFIFILIAGVFAIFWFKIKPEVFPSTYRIDYSEGSCSITDNKCEWAGDVCGGGHGICTNNPAKYEGMGGICDINNEFPANQGYTCTCLIAQGKCGWVK